MLSMPIAVSVLYHSELEENHFHLVLSELFSQVTLKSRMTNGSLSDCNAMAGFEEEMKRSRVVIAVISI